MRKATATSQQAADAILLDPRAPEVTVLTLDGDRYVDHGPFHPGSVAVSSVLDGFSVDVTGVFVAHALP